MRNLGKRAFALLLSLWFLLGPMADFLSYGFFGEPVGADSLSTLGGYESVSAASIEPLQLSIAWRTDVDGQKLRKNNAQLAMTTKNKNTLTARVTAIGSADIETKVLIETFDISAKASRGEYTHKQQTVTLKGGEYYDFTVTVGTQKFINESGDADGDDHVVSLPQNDNTWYSRQFGIRIIPQDDNSKVTSGEGYVRVHTNPHYTSDTAFWTLKTASVSNSKGAISNFPSSEPSSNTLSKGYVQSGLTFDRIGTKAFGKWLKTDGYHSTNDGMRDAGNIKVAPDEESQENTFSILKNDSVTIANSDMEHLFGTNGSEEDFKLYLRFFDLIPCVSGDMDVTDGTAVVYAGFTFRFRFKGKDDTTWKYTFNTRTRGGAWTHNWDMNYIKWLCKADDNSDLLDDDYLLGDDRENSNTQGTLDRILPMYRMIISREDSITEKSVKYWLPLDSMDDVMSIQFHNHSKVAGATKYFGNLRYWVTFIEETAPVVEEISVVSMHGNRYYTAGDEVYAAVRFSEPVQFGVIYKDGTDKVFWNDGTAAFVLKARLGSTAGKELNFQYLSGCFTDTLVFRATIPDAVDADTRLYTNKIYFTGLDDTISASHATLKEIRIVDLMPNRYGTNNAANLDIGNVTTVFDFYIDNRVPEISVDSTADLSGIHKSITVPVTVSRASANRLPTLWYKWSKERDLSSESVDQWTEISMTADGNNYHASIPSNTAMDGKYYLHLEVKSGNGQVSRKVIGAHTTNPAQDEPIVFDSTPPTIQTSVSGTEYAMYKQNHILKVHIEDPKIEGEDAVDYGRIKQIFLKIYQGAAVSGTPVFSKQVYGSGSTEQMVHLGNGDYEMTLTPKDLGLVEKDENGDNVILPHFGPYTVVVEAVDHMVADKGGNKSSDTVSQALMFDTRETFALAYDVTAIDAAYLPDGSEGDIWPEADFPIYYATPKDSTAPLTLRFYGDAAGASESYAYSVHSIFVDGVQVYSGKRVSGAGAGEAWFTGKWAEGMDHEICGFAEDPIALVEGSGSTIDLQIPFAANAQGKYEIVLVRLAGEEIKESQVVSFYITPRNAAPKNYAALYDEERLLINKVWQFTTANYYSGRNAAITAYDTTAQGAAKRPIFSDYEKAYEYAYFRELQDVEIVHLGSDENSVSIINSLNSGTSNIYRKAEGETRTASSGQTWIRYKSKVWVPAGKDASNASSWVYYFYHEQTLTQVNEAQFSYLLKEALQNNAEDIAGKGGDYVYLTKNSGLGMDGFHQPSYSKGAVFYQAQTVASSLSSVYEHDLVYSGDARIYDSFVSVELEGGGRQSLPLVGNYTFSVPNSYSRLYFRRAGDTGGWTSIPNGTNLRNVITTTGVYEFLELNGGYRHYFIYCDLTAPLLKYSFVRQPSAESEETASSEGAYYFSRTNDGDEFKAQSLHIEYFLDETHAVTGLPVEYDPYAYFYVEAAGFSQEELAFMTQELLSGEAYHFKIPNGVCVLHVYDRLGNHYSVDIKTNDSELFPTPAYEVVDNTSVTFHINRSAAEIAKFSVTHTADNGEVTIDTVYDSKKVYVKSGTYELFVEDIYGNRQTLRDVKLTRVPPEVQILAANSQGKFSELTVLPKDTPVPVGVANLTEIAPNSYRIQSATATRVTYASNAKYAYTFEAPDSVKLRESNTTSGTQLQIPATEETWILTIYYTEDPGAKIVITSSNDTTPPYISATASASQYTYFEDQGYDNVLFSLSPNRQTVDVADKEKIAAHSVTVHWNDDGADPSRSSGMDQASYTINGGASILLDPEDKYKTFTKSGEYVFSMSDRLGNTSTFSFTLDSSLHAAVILDGKETELKDPSELIYGSGASAEYEETWYTGNDFSVELREDMCLTFLRETDGEPVIYELTLSQDTATFGVHPQNGEEGKEQQTIALKTARKGTFQTSEYSIPYTYQGGILTLTFEEAGLSHEFFQMRFTDLKGTIPYIAQIERSNLPPALTVIRAESKTKIQANAASFTGINEGFTFRGTASELVSLVAYRSVRYTTDFSYVSEANTIDLLNKTSFRTVTEEGYYKIVAKNRYGNEQVFLIRIHYGSDINVLLTYATGDGLTYTLTEEGTWNFYTNASAEVKIWDLNAELSVKKDNKLYQAKQSTASGYIDLSFTEVGEYSVDVQDDSGNRFVIRLSIQAPRALTYHDFMTGFNPDALMREEHYTNRPVSLDKRAIDTAGVVRVAYRKIKAKDWTWLYDVISEAQVPYTSEGFLDCIGGENGNFEVLFADRYGNQCIETVSISDLLQLEISRTAKATAFNRVFTQEDIENDAIYSNLYLHLKNQAGTYRLTVDGTEVYFNEKGVYTLELPLSLGEDVSQDHRVVYTDSYGNKQEFTAHLMRRSPVVRQTILGEQRLDEDSVNTIHIKGIATFVWDDRSLEVLCSKDGAPAVPYAWGEEIKTDGLYVITFTDCAGNSVTKRVKRDTTVLYEMRTGNTAAYHGVSTSGTLTIRGDGEEIFFQEVLRNGKPYEKDIDRRSLSFSDHGSYEVKLTDGMDNEVTLSFSIYDAPQQAFTYEPQGEYIIYQVWYNASGEMQIYNAIRMTSEGTQAVDFHDDGEYRVDLLYVPDSTYHSFAIQVDNLPPAVKMKGAVNGSTTVENVTFEGLTRGDVLEVWESGKLIRTYEIGTSVSTPEIREAGDYRIVIRDEAENQIEFSFIREYTTNTASNVVVCIMLGAAAIGIALFLRSRSAFRTK